MGNRGRRIICEDEEGRSRSQEYHERVIKDMKVVGSRIGDSKDPSLTESLLTARSRRCKTSNALVSTI